MSLLKDFPLTRESIVQLRLLGSDVRIWKSSVDAELRAYTAQQPPGPSDWQILKPITAQAAELGGVQAAFHYVVETDIPPDFEAEFNDWYATEHLPGLARVAGTLRAYRFERVQGAPKYLACYDLVDENVLGSPDWMAVRNTAWSSRVRPHFCNTRRTLYTRYELPRA